MLRFRQLSLAAMLLPLPAVFMYMLLIVRIWPEPNAILSIFSTLFFLAMIAIFLGSFWAVTVSFFAVKKNAPGVYQYRRNRLGSWAQKHFTHKNFCEIIWGLGFITMIPLIFIAMFFTLGFVGILLTVLKILILSILITSLLAGMFYLVERYPDTLDEWEKHRYVTATLGVFRKIGTSTKHGWEKMPRLTKKERICPLLDVN